MNTKLSALINSISSNDTLRSIDLAIEINSILEGTNVPTNGGSFVLNFPCPEHKILTIKAYREVTNTGLSEAKIAVESNFPKFASANDAIKFLKIYHGYEIDRLRNDMVHLQNENARLKDENNRW